MKLAIDPYMFRSVPLLELPALVAELGYERIELSPGRTSRRSSTPPARRRRHRPQVPRRAVRGRCGRGLCPPALSVEGPDEDERQGAVRYWKRAIEIASLLDVDTMNSELNGNPRQAAVCERQFWRSMGELLPVFQREGIRLVLEPHPDDWEENGHRALDLIRGINSPLVCFLYCAPHLPPGQRRPRHHAPGRALLEHKEDLAQ
jgi:myo-inositol catabolism protein IolH